MTINSNGHAITENITVIPPSGKRLELTTNGISIKLVSTERSLWELLKRLRDSKTDQNGSIR